MKSILSRGEVKDGMRDIGNVGCHDFSRHWNEGMDVWGDRRRVST
ncbi:hypothetical protein [Desulfosarcina cetonica]|nr:hypothetical protein [Desulfosarcina cetonica]